MGFDKAIRFVIRDGAGQSTRTFDDVFPAIGATVITIPPDCGGSVDPSALVTDHFSRRAPRKHCAR